MLPYGSAHRLLGEAENDEALEARIRAAAEQAHAARFIEDLPGGYQTVVGDRGVRLSRRAALRSESLSKFQEESISV